MIVYRILHSCPLSSTKSRKTKEFFYVIWEYRTTHSKLTINFCSSSSLYYWAHYDFFNNTRFGEPVQGTACDEVIASWKQRAGRLRSPLNTLVYKQAPPGEDVHCLYRFVTDKRIYARVILTILSINFKVHGSLNIVKLVYALSI